jgi:hypothetical protein
MNQQFANSAHPDSNRGLHFIDRGASTIAPRRPVEQPETAMTVSISHRVFDAGETTQPATVSTLLRELGMSHSCVGKQKVALGTWLMIHEPRRPLRPSLRENGYGPLLKASDGRRARSGNPA